MTSSDHGGHAPRQGTPTEASQAGVWIGDAAVAAGGMVYQQALSFLSGFLIAREVGAALYGVINVARSLVGIAAIFTRLGLDLGLQRYFGAALDNASLAQRFRTLHVLRQVAAAIALLPIVLLLMGLGTWLESHVYRFEQFGSVLLWTAVALPFLTDLGILGGAYRGIGRIRPSIVAEFFVLPTVRLALILLLFLFGLRLWAVVAGTTAATLLSALLLGWRARADLRSTQSDTPPPAGATRAELRQVIGYSAVLAASVGVTTLTRSIDNLMLGHYSTPADVGQYAVMQMMLSLVGIFGMAFGQRLGAQVAQRHAAGDREGLAVLLRLNLRWIALVASPAFAIFVFWGDRFALIFGPSFQVDAVVVFWLASGALVVALFSSAGYSLSMTGHHVVEFWLLVLGLILTGGLCLALIPAMGQKGAAIAAFAGALAVNLARLGLVWRMMRIFPIDLSSAIVVLASVLLAQATFHVQRWVGLTGLPGMIAAIALFACAYAGLAWRQFLTDGERHEIRSRIPLAKV